MVAILLCPKAIEFCWDSASGKKPKNAKGKDEKGLGPLFLATAELVAVRSC